MSEDDYIVVGKILTTHGIKGWLTIKSYTSPIKNIFKYSLKVNLDKTFKNIKVTDYRFMSKKTVMKIENINTIEDTSQFINHDLVILKNDLPMIDDNEYYWHQLIGKKVITSDNKTLGIVESLFTSGDNDILVVKTNKKKGKELFIPFLKDNIIDIKLDENIIVTRQENEI
jgi:16S rRNA processing protein RimM